MFNSNSLGMNRPQRTRLRHDVADRRGDRVARNCGRYVARENTALRRSPMEPRTGRALAGAYRRAANLWPLFGNDQRRASGRGGANAVGVRSIQHDPCRAPTRRQFRPHVEGGRFLYRPPRPAIRSISGTIPTPANACASSTSPMIRTTGSSVIGLARLRCPALIRIIWSSRRTPSHSSSTGLNSGPTILVIHEGGHAYYPNRLDPDIWRRESSGKMVQVSELFRYFVRRSDVANAKLDHLPHNGILAADHAMAAVDADGRHTWPCDVRRRIPSR